MWIGYANSAQHKREHMPKRKRSRSRSGGLDGRDDLNYVDEDSELSSGDDALMASDVEALHDSSGGGQHTRKRGRPKAHYAASERSRSQTHSASQVTASAAALAAASQNYIPPANPSGYVSDHDESGETKVDKYGRLLGGNKRKEKKPSYQREKGKI